MIDKDPLGILDELKKKKGNPDKGDTSTQIIDNPPQTTEDKDPLGILDELKKKDTPQSKRRDAQSDYSQASEGSSRPAGNGYQWESPSLDQEESRLESTDADLRIPTEEERDKVSGSGSRVMDMSSAERGVSDIISAISPIKGEVADKVTRGIFTEANSEKVYQENKKLLEGLSINSDDTDMMKLMKASLSSDNVDIAKNKSAVNTLIDKYELNQEVRGGGTRNPVIVTPEDKIQRLMDERGLSGEFALFKESKKLLQSGKELAEVVKNDKGLGSGIVTGSGDYIMGYVNFADNIKELITKDKQSAIAKLKQKIQKHNSIDQNIDYSEKEERYIELNKDRDFLSSFSEKMDKYDKYVQSGDINKAEDIESSFTEDEKFYMKANEDKLYKQINTKNEEVRNSLEPFTEGERAFIDASQNYSDLLLTYQDRVNTSYKIGQAIGQSAAFMGEFALTGGLFKLGAKGGAAIVKGLSKQAGKRLGITAPRNKAMKFIANKASRGVSEVTGSAFRATGMPTLYTDWANRVGDGEDAGKALFKSYATVFKESLVERMFVGSGGTNPADGFLGAIGQATSGAKNPLQLLKGMGLEVVEEEIAQVGDHLIRGDDFRTMIDKMTDVENQKVLVGSVAIMQGGLGGIKATGMAKDYLKALRLERKSPYLDERGFDFIVNKANNSLARSRLMKWAKNTDPQLRSDIDAAFSTADGGIDFAEALNTTNTVLKETLAEYEKSGSYSKEQLGKMTVDAMNYLKWKIRDVAADVSKKNAESKVKEYKKNAEKEVQQEGQKPQEQERTEEKTDQQKEEVDAVQEQETEGVDVREQAETSQEVDKEVRGEDTEGQKKDLKEPVIPADVMKSSSEAFNKAKEESKMSDADASTEAFKNVERTDWYKNLPEAEKKQTKEKFYNEIAERFPDKGGQKKTKEKLPSQKPKTKKVVDTMVELKKSLRAEDKAAKRGKKLGEKEMKDMKNSMLNVTRDALRSGEFNEAQVSSITPMLTAVRNANTKKSLSKAVDYVLNKVQQLENKETISTAKKKATKIGSKIRDKKSFFGTIDDAVKSLIGKNKQRDGVLFNPEVVYNAVGKDKFNEYVDVLDKLDRVAKGESMDVLGMDNKQFRKFTNDIVKEVQGFQKFNADISETKNQLSNELSEAVDFTSNKIDDLATEVAEKNGYTEGQAKGILRKARKIALQRKLDSDVTKAISTSGVLEDSRARIDLKKMAEKYAKDYGVETSEAMKIIESTPAYKNMVSRKYDNSLAMEAVKPYAPELAGTVDYMMSEEYGNEYFGTNPELDILRNELAEVLSYGDKSTSLEDRIVEAAGKLRTEQDAKNFIKAINNMAQGLVDAKLNVRDFIKDIKTNDIIRRSHLDGNNSLALDDRLTKKTNKTWQNVMSKEIPFYKKPKVFLKNVSTAISRGLFGDNVMKTFRGTRISGLSDLAESLSNIKVRNLVKWGSKGDTKRLKKEIDEKIESAAKFFKNNTPNYLLGTVINPFNQRGAEQFYEDIYSEFSDGASSYTFRMKEISKSLAEKFDKVVASDYIKRLRKKHNASSEEFLSEIITKMVQVQEEAQANNLINPSTKEVVTVADYVDKIESVVKNKDTRNYHTMRDVTLMRNLLNDSDISPDGRTVNAEKIRSNKDINDILDYMEDVSQNELFPKIAYTQRFDRKGAFDPIKKFSHRVVYNENGVLDRNLDFNSNIKGGEKSPASSSFERKATVPAISFMGVQSFMRNVTDVLYDHHVGASARSLLGKFDEIRRTKDSEIAHDGFFTRDELNDIFKEGSKQGIVNISNVVDKIKEFKSELSETTDKAKKKELQDKIEKLEFNRDFKVRFMVVEKVMNETMEKELEDSQMSISGWDKMIDKIFTNVNASVLARPDRAATETIANLIPTFTIAAFTKNGNRMADLGSYGDYTSVMKHTASEILNRMGKGDWVDYGVQNRFNLARSRKSKRTGVEKALDFMSKGRHISGVQDLSKKISSKMIRTPDMIAGRTTWRIYFNRRFKTMTGENFDLNRFNADKDYRAKFAKELKKASSYADLGTMKYFAPSVRANGVFDIAYGSRASEGIGRHFSRVNNLFRSFVANDAIQFSRSLATLLDRSYTGEAKADAAKMMASVYARQFAYAKGIQLSMAITGAAANAAFAAAFEDRDPDKNPIQELIDSPEWEDLRRYLSKELDMGELVEEGILAGIMIPLSKYKTIVKAPLMYGVDKIEKAISEDYRGVYKAPEDRNTYYSMSADQMFGTLNIAIDGYNGVIESIAQGAENSRLETDIVSNGVGWNAFSSSYQFVDAFLGLPFARPISRSTKDFGREMQLENRIGSYAKQAVKNNMDPGRLMRHLAAALKEDGIESLIYGISDKDLKAVTEAMSLEYEEKGLSLDERIAKKRDIIDRMNLNVSHIRDYYEKYISYYILDKGGELQEDFIKYKPDGEKESKYINPKDLPEMIKAVKKAGTFNDDAKIVADAYSVDYDYDVEDGSAQVSTLDDLVQMKLSMEGNDFDQGQDAPSSWTSNIERKWREFEEDTKGWSDRQVIEGKKRILDNMFLLANIMAGDNGAAFEEKIVNVDIPSGVNAKVGTDRPVIEKGSITYGIIGEDDYTEIYDRYIMMLSDLEGGNEE